MGDAALRRNIRGWNCCGDRRRRRTRSRVVSCARSATQAAREASDSTRPIADTLARIETHIRDIEAQRQHMMGGLEQQLGALSKETVALSQALRAPNARGRWGELTLRRVAELAGMVPYCDFYEQESGAAQRPDMLVRLPGGRTLAVDAKVPLGGVSRRRSRHRCACARRPRSGPARAAAQSSRYCS